MCQTLYNDLNDLNFEAESTNPPLPIIFTSNIYI